MQKQNVQRDVASIRTAKPDVQTLNKFKHNMAWADKVPTVGDIRRLLSEHPNTTILTLTRIGATEINELALQTKFPRRELLAHIHGDAESNPNNYMSGRLKAMQLLKPMAMRIYKGMPVYMTKNVRKDLDMRGVVESFDSDTGGIRIMTRTGTGLSSLHGPTSTSAA